MSDATSLFDMPGVVIIIGGLIAVGSPAFALFAYRRSRGRSANAGRVWLLYILSQEGFACAFVSGGVLVGIGPAEPANTILMWLTVLTAMFGAGASALWIIALSPSERRGQRH